RAADGSRGEGRLRRSVRSRDRLRGPRPEGRRGQRRAARRGRLRGDPHRPSRLRLRQDRRGLDPGRGLTRRDLPALGARGQGRGALMATRSALEPRPRSTSPTERVRLLTFTTLFAIGGTERHVVSLADGLDYSRFELEFGCHRRSGEFLEQIEARGLSVSEYAVARLYGPHALAQQLRFARHLRRRRIQIMHSYNFYPNVFAIPAARLARTPVVLASIRDTGAQRVGEAHFLVIGDNIDPDGSRYRGELESRAARLGLQKRVIFTGFRLDVPRLLSAVSVSVLPSLSEGLSNTILESMAAGAPVVATRVGGSPEALEDGVDGLLVPPRDSAALSRALGWVP